MTAAPNPANSQISSPRVEEVAPGDTPRISSIGQSSDDQREWGETASQTAADEEPALGLEPDLPSDGRDVEGESMIRELPRLTERADPVDRRGDPKPDID